MRGHRVGGEPHAGRSVALRGAREHRRNACQTNRRPLHPRREGDRALQRLSEGAERQRSADRRSRRVSLQQLHSARVAATRAAATGAGCDPLSLLPSAPAAAGSHARRGPRRVRRLSRPHGAHPGDGRHLANGLLRRRRAALGTPRHVTARIRARGWSAERRQTRSSFDCDRRRARGGTCVTSRRAV